MARPELPSFLRDLVADRDARRMLLVASVSLAAAGFQPKVFWPGLGSVQAALRERPEAEVALLTAAVVGALVLLVGGVLGDADGRRRILTGSLVVLLASDLLGLLPIGGPVFLVSQLIGAAAASLILPIALAGVATRYDGVVRATAIGIAYAAYGGGQAAAPVLLTILGPTGPRWPAFVVASVVAVVALVAARRTWTDLPAPTRGQRRRILATAVFAGAVILLSVGIIGAGSGDGRLTWLRLGCIVGGVTLLAVAGGLERRAGPGGLDAVRIDRRPVAVALFVGFIIAAAQVVPMAQLPVYLQLVARYGPILAVLATVPFMLALVVTGPIAGWLLGRLGPRPLLAGSVAAIGLGDIALGLLLGRDTNYLGYVLPLVALGAGFVIATTVRTAIIFASVPRGLPATAAALNEASVSLGTRAGLVFATTAIATIALDRFAATLVGMPASEAEPALAAFRDLLVAVGTPAYASLVAGVDASSAPAYVAAYTDAVRTALVAVGAVALVSSVITWFLVGPRTPLASVWELREERPGRPDPSAGEQIPA